MRLHQSSLYELRPTGEDERSRGRGRAESSGKAALMRNSNFSAYHWFQSILQQLLSVEGGDNYNISI